MYNRRQRIKYHIHAHTHINKQNLKNKEVFKILKRRMCPISNCPWKLLLHFFNLIYTANFLLWCLSETYAYYDLLYNNCVAIWTTTTINWIMAFTFACYLHQICEINGRNIRKQKIKMAVFGKKDITILQINRITELHNELRVHYFEL